MNLCLSGIILVQYYIGHPHVKTCRLTPTKHHCAAIMKDLPSHRFKYRQQKQQVLFVHTTTSITVT